MKPISNDAFLCTLDQLDEYDRLHASMTHQLNDAMLELAHIKFLDPYCSVSTNGFVPTPATRGVTNGQFAVTNL